MLISNNIKPSDASSAQFLDADAPAAIVSYDGDYKILEFNSVGTFPITFNGEGVVDLLLVGGGQNGSSGNSSTGGTGGDGGEVVEQHDFAVSGQTYNVTVGGANSNTSFSTLTALGGGGVPGGASGGGTGSDGTESSITGTLKKYGPSGGGGGNYGQGGGPGGDDGGGNGGSNNFGASGGNGQNGTDNLGAGAGGGAMGSEQGGSGGQGGKGVAIFKIKIQ